MSFFTLLRKIDRRFSLGLLMGILFGMAGLYAAFVYERRPHLTVDVMSNASILDVKEKLGGLEILFNGVDIQQSDQTLRIMLVRIGNDGQADILIDSFDAREPIGFAVSPGQVVQPPDLSESTSDYLRTNVKIHLAEPATLTIDPIILERGQHFTLKLLVLVPKNAIPEVSPVGKIAGAGNIAVITSYLRTGTPAFLTRTFSGDILVHVVRLLAYTVIAITLLVIGVLLGTAIADFLSRRKRARLSRAYLRSLSFEPAQPFPQLLDLYRKDGETVLFALADVSANPRALIRRSHIGDHDIVEDVSPVYSDLVFVAPDYKRLVRSLELSGVIRKVGEGHVLNTEVARLLPDFAKFLRSKGAIDEAARFRLRKRRKPAATTARKGART